MKTKIITSVICLIILYLLCSFTAASFDIERWDEAGIFLVALLYGIMLIVIFILMENKND